MNLGYVKKQTYENVIIPYLYKRRSIHSQQNVLFILRAFSNFMKQDLLSTTKHDAECYVFAIEKKTGQGSLKKNYGRMIFIELRAFFSYCVSVNLIHENPFITTSLKDKRFIETVSFPDLSKVDLLLEVVEDENLYLAIMLALRMALSIQEIADLKKENIIDKEEGLYIHVEKKIHNRPQERYLLVPNDIENILLDRIYATEDEFPYLLVNSYGRKISPRSLQQHLKTYTDSISVEITFSDLRNWSIYLMLAGKVDPEKVKEYAGVKGAWLDKYDTVPEEMKFDAAVYSKLKVMP